VRSLQTTRAYLERIRREWTVAALAEASGVSAADIYKIEAGRLRPTARQAAKIAGVLNLDPAALADPIDLEALLGPRAKVHKRRSCGGGVAA
jgi:transcriptional regulator with XRE-family HTH domain